MIAGQVRGRGSAWAAAGALAGLVLLLAGCAAAVHAPRPLPSPAPNAASTPPAELLREAAESFARRPDRAAVERALTLYLAAAAADRADVAGPLGAARVAAWRIEHERDAAARERLLATELDAAGWCGERTPGDAACDYALAIALGQQARERPATAVDGLKKMVAALRRAAAARPELDEGGPDRVLALVLLRAPGWPAGPGDPDEGLAAARRAVALRPGYAPNQLALGEALRASGDRGAARTAYAAALAAAAASADPDAAAWAADARAGLDASGS